MIRTKSTIRNVRWRLPVTRSYIDCQESTVTFFPLNWSRDAVDLKISKVKSVSNILVGNFNQWDQWEGLSVLTWDVLCWRALVQFSGAKRETRNEMTSLYHELEAPETGPAQVLSTNISLKRKMRTDRTTRLLIVILCLFLISEFPQVTSRMFFNWVARIKTDFLVRKVSMRILRLPFNSVCLAIWIKAFYHLPTGGLISLEKIFHLDTAKKNTLSDNQIQE